MAFLRHCTFLILVILLTGVSKSNGTKTKRKISPTLDSFVFTSREITPSDGYESTGTSWLPSHIPLQETHYYPGQTLSKLLTIPTFNPVDIDLKVNFPDPVPNAIHNSVEKPVDEPQEYVPPQSVGSASIPLMPPPAIPVNAAASNVPATNGAVFLGSGSLGVVSLGNGAYALGSGSLGYSGMRSQPRPTIRVPVYPPLPASPNLIPAAVPSPQPPPPPQLPPGFPPSGFGYPVIPADPNAYEPISRDRVAFGSPVIRPPRPPRMHFATASPQQPQPIALPPFDFGTTGTSSTVFGQRTSLPIYIR